MKNDEKSSSSVDLAALQLLMSATWLVAAGSSSADIECYQHRTEFSRSPAVECFPLDLYTASSLASFFSVRTFPPQKGFSWCLGKGPQKQSFRIGEPCFSLIPRGTLEHELHHGAGSALRQGMAFCTHPPLVSHWLPWRRVALGAISSQHSQQPGHR